ncbi:MAG: hypothetical protein ACP5RD_08800, partial [bacterium]
MLEKIKTRLPGGIYFNDLLIIIKDFIKGRFTFYDRYLLDTYFIGNSYAIDKLYNTLSKQYLDNNYLNFKGIKIFDLKNDSINARGAFIGEFFDFIYPYLFNDYSYVHGEGPYLYQNVQINKGDVVIDAGANIGLFSALASFLGGIVYAFEPVKETREKY